MFVINNPFFLNIFNYILLNRFTYHIYIILLSFIFYLLAKILFLFSSFWQIFFQLCFFFLIFGPLIFFSIFCFLNFKLNKKNLLYTFAVFFFECLFFFSFFLFFFLLSYFDFAGVFMLYFSTMLSSISPYLAYLNFPYYFKIDYQIDIISLWLLILTTFLILICIFISWNYINYNIKEYILLFFLLEFLLIQFFLISDLLLFFFFFELTLIPMYLLIAIWGSRQRKIHASYVFFFFTLLGSLLMTISIIYLIFLFKTSDFFLLTILLKNNELNTIYLNNSKLSYDLLHFFWISFFIGFSVKIPIYPFHVWLPEAHVEASTAGSVILAGILLKMGIYGLIKTNWSFLPLLSNYYSPLVLMLCMVGILYTSIITLRQNDIKKVIAYSSVGHMGYCVLGLTILNNCSFSGTIFIMLSHGLISSLLFILVGFLYERYHTRLINFYGGVSQIMPIFSLFFFLALLANMSFPLTSGFIGELLILFGLVNYSIVLTIFASLGTIFCGIYTIWLYTRICHGILVPINSIMFFHDLNYRECLICFIFLFLIYGFGLFPNFFLIKFKSLAIIFNLQLTLLPF